MSRPVIAETVVTELTEDVKIVRELLTSAKSAKARKALIQLDDILVSWLNIMED